MEVLVGIEKKLKMIENKINQSFLNVIDSDFKLK